MVSRAEAFRPKNARNTCLGVIVAGLVSCAALGAAAYVCTRPDLLNRTPVGDFLQDHNFLPTLTPTPTGSVEPARTSTPTATAEPYSTPTLTAPIPDADAKAACSTMKSLQGHFNQHQEFQIPAGNPQTDNTVTQKLVGWFHNYWEKYHSDANDPLIQTLKNLGVKLYSDIVPSTDINTLHLRVKTEKTGENFVFFATEAQDINATLANIKSEYTKFYSQYGLTFTEDQLKEFDASLKQNLGITKIEGNNVTVNMGYVENGQFKSHEFTFIAGKTSPDVYPFGPLKGSDRLAAVTQIKFENGKPVVNPKTGTELGKVQLIVIDDFATEIMWNGKLIKCSGSTNRVETPTPSSTPTGTVATRTPTPPGVTETPGGPDTPTPPGRTPRGTATVQPPKSVPTSTSQPAPVTPETGPEPTSTRIHNSTPVPTQPPAATAKPATPQPTDAPDNFATPVPRPTSSVNSQINSGYMTWQEWQNGGDKAFVDSIFAALRGRGN